MLSRYQKDLIILLLLVSFTATICIMWLSHPGDDGVWFLYMEGIVIFYTMVYLGFNQSSRL